MKNGLDEEGRRKCKLRINITISFSHFRLVLLFGIQQIVSTTHLTQSLKLFNFSTPGVYPKTFSSISKTLFISKTIFISYLMQNIIECVPKPFYNRQVHN